MSIKKKKIPSSITGILAIWGITAFLGFGVYVTSVSGINGVWIIGILPISERVLFWIFLGLSILAPIFEVADKIKKRKEADSSDIDES